MSSAKIAPVQAKPSPWNPGRHEQVKPPIVLLQRLPTALQLCRSKGSEVVHSLMSLCLGGIGGGMGCAVLESWSKRIAGGLASWFSRACCGRKLPQTTVPLPCTATSAPVHVNPLPVKPAMQVHVRLPTVLVQVALPLQPPLFVKHSSMSAGLSTLLQWTLSSSVVTLYSLQCPHARKKPSCHKKTIL